MQRRRTGTQPVKSCKTPCHTCTKVYLVPTSKRASKAATVLLRFPEALHHPQEGHVSIIRHYAGGCTQRILTYLQVLSTS